MVSSETVLVKNTELWDCVKNDVTSTNLSIQTLSNVLLLTISLCCRLEKVLAAKNKTPTFIFCKFMGVRMILGVSLFRINKCCLHLNTTDMVFLQTKTFLGIYFPVNSDHESLLPKIKPLYHCSLPHESSLCLLHHSHHVISE